MASLKFFCSDQCRLITTAFVLTFLLFRFYRIYKLQAGPEETLNITSTTTFPNDVFFFNLAAYYRLLIRIQAKVDAAAISRKTVTGTISWYPSQIYYYARIVSDSKIKNVCELGYGAGNSALLYLTINSNVTLYSFDLFPEPNDRALVPETTPRQGWYQKVTLNHIHSSKDFSRRFYQIVGNSNTTIPKFAHEHPYLKCDLISIDGSHRSPQVYFDIVHFKELATSDSRVILDDVNEKPVRKDMDRAIAEGLLKRHECLIPEQRHDENFKVFEFAEKLFCVACYRL